MTEPATPRTHVVVVGGGYAGTLAANRLRQRTDIDITLVNPRSVFVERIRLHQLVADTGAATADYGTLLGDDIRLIVDTVERIETPDRRVLLTSGAELSYDYLIYAVGSTGAMAAKASGVPGLSEFAYSVADLESAQRLRYALSDLPLAAPLTVVGGGLTGIETASELAERGRQVTLVCGGPLGPSLSNRGRRSVAKRLRKLGVNVLESVAAREVRWDAVVLADGVVLPSAATVWTAGFAVPDLAARSGLRTDAVGRLLTDQTLTSIDDPRIVAAGDCAAPSGQPLRMSCQAAGPLAAQAANTVLSRIAGNPPAVLNQAFVGQCISLGRAHGTLQGDPVGDPARGSQTRFVLLAQGRHAARTVAGRRAGRSAMTRAPTPGEHAERFTLLRPLLFTIAYEILGSATEADDVLQDSYLRWADVDLSTVRDTKSYLAQLVTRQALNALRADARRREEYVGPWLPEPLLLDEQDPSADVVLAESVSMAMLVLLETLSPDERAVFVLREVFGFDYSEIAEAVGKPAPTVRQVAHRAREHVRARRRRFESVDAERNAEITAQFLATASTGDVEALMTMLAPDATWTADSGGIVSAARRPVVGADRVARAIAGLMRRAGEIATLRVEMVTCNSAPAVLLYLGERLEGLITLEIADDKITNFYVMRNPEKLAALATPRDISRS